MINDLLRINELNPASVQKIEWTPVGAVLGWNEPIGGRFSQALFFRPGWRWYGVYGTPGTIGFSEKQQRSRGRVYYEVRAVAFLPNDSDTFRSQLQWMAYPRFYLRITDQLGKKIVVGRPEQGLEMLADFNNEVEMGGKRGYMIEFTGKVSFPAGFYPFT